MSGFGSSSLDAPLVVSTVPTAGQAAAAGLPWRAEHTVLDVLYDPWPTPLAQRVDQAGGTVIAGSEVLFWQATAQVELMTGQSAPLGRHAPGTARGARAPAPLLRCRPPGSG